MGDATLSPPSAPETFGPYRLDALVGRGGMGEVWRAYDTRRRRTVALERLVAEQSDRPEFRARFRRESELAARLAAPNVIPIHDFGEIDGRLFLDMRLVDGRDLAAVPAAGGPLPPSRTAPVVTHLAAAPDAAQAAGLVHRDVKPSNALLSGDAFHGRLHQHPPAGGDGRRPGPGHVGDRHGELRGGEPAVADRVPGALGGN